MSLNRKTVLLELETASVNDFQKVAEKLRSEITKTSYIVLSGDLAAGKTTFVQKFCELYDLHEVSSPTFAIHQTYENSKIVIDHFDLYRLNSAADVETSGLWDVFSKSAGLVFIEWPERISLEDLPLNWMGFEIQILKLDENKRKLTLSRLFS